MSLDVPAQTPVRASPPPLIQLYQILFVVLLWNCGYKGARVLNTLYALELGAQPLETGVLLGMYGLFPLLLAVYAGRISDRYGVRRPLMVGVTAAAVGVILPYFWPSFPVLFIAAAITGAGFVFVQLTMQSLIGSLGSGAERTRNINSYALAVSVADFIGPVLAGFSIDHAGHVQTYLYLGLTSVASVLAVLYFRRRFPTAGPALDREQHRMVDLLNNEQLRRVLVVSGVLVTSLDLFQMYLPLYGHSIGLSASVIGLALGAFAAAGFFTRAMIPTLARRYGEGRTLFFSIYLAAATFVLIPFFRDGFTLGLICFALGLGMGLGQPLLVVLTYNHAPAGRAGEALGLRIAINNSIHFMVPTAFGAIGSWVGLAPVFWITAAFLAVGGRATRAVK
jgi:MFS family permease